MPLNNIKLLRLNLQNLTRMNFAKFYGLDFYGQIKENVLLVFQMKQYNSCLILLCEPLKTKRVEVNLHSFLDDY